MYRKSCHAGPHWRQPLPRVTPSSAPPLGDLIETIKQDFLSREDFNAVLRAEISDVHPIASYNWVDGSSPEIIVPGKPPRWTPLTKPRKLGMDDGVYYRDINAASYPNHPVEPAIVSVMKMCPAPMPVDIVACGSTIGNLRRFVTGKDQDRLFRILVEVVGNTVHFIRRENSPREQIPDVKGYGHKFPEAYTTWDKDVKRSKSHQRILKYRFADLEMLVRFEGDGYIESSDPKVLQLSPTEKNADYNEDTVSQLSNLRVEGSVPNPRNNDSSLKVIDGGQAVPQEAIFDLKTRSIRRRDWDTLDDQLPRLWIAQVEQFILGFHMQGLFEDIEVKNVKDDVKKWEKANQSSLIRLAALLRLIIDRAQNSEDGRLELISYSAESLEIRKPLPDVGVAFSDNVKTEWAEWLTKGQTKRFETGKSDGVQSSPKLGRDDVVGDDSFHDEFDSDEPDYTACDRECGYCGKCEY